MPVAELKPRRLRGASDRRRLCRRARPRDPRRPTPRAVPRRRCADRRDSRAIPRPRRTRRRRGRLCHVLDTIGWSQHRRQLSYCVVCGSPEIHRTQPVRTQHRQTRRWLLDDRCRRRRATRGQAWLVPGGGSSTGTAGVVVAPSFPSRARKWSSDSRRSARWSAGPAHRRSPRRAPPPPAQRLRTAASRCTSNLIVRSIRSAPARGRRHIPHPREPRTLRHAESPPERRTERHAAAQAARRIVTLVTWARSFSMTVRVDLWNDVWVVSKRTRRTISTIGDAVYTSALAGPLITRRRRRPAATRQ